MARTWLSIRVDLVEGHGEQYWPRPGRIFAAARSHSFRQLADAIDDAFARWDRSHLQEFTLTGQTRLCQPDRTGRSRAKSPRTTSASSCRGCSRANSSCTCSTWATTGHTCARSARSGSTRSRRLGSCQTSRCRTGAGATFPTSTAASGTATTASHPSPRIPGSLIFRRFGLTGARRPTAEAQVHGACSRVSASQAITRLRLAGRAVQIDPDRYHSRPIRSGPSQPTERRFAFTLRSRSVIASRP